MACRWFSEIVRRYVRGVDIDQFVRCTLRPGDAGTGAGKSREEWSGKPVTHRKTPGNVCSCSANRREGYECSARMAREINVNETTFWLRKPRSTLRRAYRLWPKSEANPTKHHAARPLAPPPGHGHEWADRLAPHYPRASRQRITTVERSAGPRRQKSG